MSERPVRWQRRGAVGQITLDRPAWDNACTEPLLDELLRLLAEEAADEAVRAVMLTGAGRGFCTGADLRELGRPGDVDLRPGLELGGAVVSTIRDLPKPVVAAVNGPAVGAGVSLALACDLVLAARSAAFRLAFVDVGLTLDCGASALVSAAVGRTRAFHLALLGEPLPAGEALSWGLISGVYDDEALLPAAIALAQRLAAGPTRAYAATKSALNAASCGLLADAIAHENRLQARLARTSDVREGIAAFLERRPAAFTGR